MILREVKIISTIPNDVWLQLFIACCSQKFLHVSFMMEQLANLYYNPKSGYQSASKIKSKLSHISSIDINKFLQQQKTFQLNKEVKKPSRYNTINASFPAQNFQIDIMIYDRFETNHYKYILVCIDVYSRYLQCRPLTNRKFPNIMKNLQNIFEQIGIPGVISCDNEFNTYSFNEYATKTTSSSTSRNLMILAKML